MIDYFKEFDTKPSLLFCKHDPRNGTIDIYTNW